MAQVRAPEVRPNFPAEWSGRDRVADTGDQIGAILVDHPHRCLGG